MAIPSGCACPGPDCQQCDECYCHPHSDPCPKCGTELRGGLGGGVVCPKPGCGYWFCY